MKTKKAIVSTVIYIALLLAFYMIHIKFFTVDVVFYSAILDSILAAFTAACILAWLPQFNPLSIFEKGQLTIIWLLLGYAIAITVPTIIDRSLSFYILEKLDQRGGGIQQHRFADVFTVEYLKEHRLVDVRLTEQLASGTIVIEHNCVKLTKRGQQLANFSRFFRQNLLPKKRLLMGEHTDVLTDPFRDSSPGADYSCK